MKNRWPALLELLETAGPRLHALLVRLTLREDVAEDLLQDLFLRLNASEGFLKAADPTAFAFRSAIHLAFDWRRSKNRRASPAPLDIEPAATAPSPLGAMVQREELEQVLEAAQDLSEGAREAFVLHYIQQESYEAIAAATGRTPQQVRGLAYKAVVGIRERLSEPEPGLKPAEISNEDR